jgi:hypothetical protein
VLVAKTSVTQIDAMYEKQKAYSDGVTQKAAAHQLGWLAATRTTVNIC